MKLKEVLKYVQKNQMVVIMHKTGLNCKFKDEKYKLYDGSIEHNKLLNSEIKYIGSCNSNLVIALDKEN